MIKSFDVKPDSVIGSELVVMFNLKVVNANVSPLVLPNQVRIIPSVLDRFLNILQSLGCLLSRLSLRNNLAVFSTDKYLKHIYSWVKISPSYRVSNSDIKILHCGK